MYKIQELYYIIISLEIDVTFGSLLHFQVVHVCLYISVLHCLRSGVVCNYELQYENKAAAVD